ncbi:hypothetical protein C8A01DRAFT_43722 [Parachaetomium inaequale]|uniref:Uncharacterized protein n=1 Tax=Parachaetomium inaequale TaxID=2588326 RepID=A0AAN6SUB9_9PEZI|nr:hypothetical protein C8A01DRAFT_43722 [Parachaetomium inaequale]
MPPPHLHPRSRMTSSLFATTVLASFFVVALPHILPCPAPRRAYADGEMVPTPSGVDEGNAGVVRRVRRRRRVDVVDCDGGSGSERGACGKQGGGGGSVDGIGVVEFRPGTGEDGADGSGRGRRVKGARGRACPVPKPGGILGEWLGFNASGGGTEGGEKTRPDR